MSENELNEPGCILIPMKHVFDNRGSFHKINYAGSFKEQFYTVSKQMTIRGMHIMTGECATEKLVYCIKGKVLDVCLNLRRGSYHYGKAATYHLAQDSALYIPKGFAHGFLALSDCIMMYNTAEKYKPEFDKGVKWNSFEYNWGIKKPIISDKDKNLPELKDITEEVIYYEEKV